MIETGKWPLGKIAGILSIVFFCSAAVLQAAEPSRIFILHSYEEDHICGQPQHDGVIDALSRNGFHAGKDFTLGVFYMDTKRKNNTPALIARQAAAAMEQIEAFAPDVLVTLDDNAFKHVGLRFAGSCLFRHECTA